MSLDRAILQLEAEVADFKQGTSEQPGEGTAEWYVLRAKSVGLTYLRKAKQLGVDKDIRVAEKHFRMAASELKVEGK